MIKYVKCLFKMYGTVVRACVTVIGITISVVAAYVFYHNSDLFAGFLMLFGVSSAFKLIESIYIHLYMTKVYMRLPTSVEDIEKLNMTAKECMEYLLSIVIVRPTKVSMVLRCGSCILRAFCFVIDMIIFVFNKDNELVIIDAFFPKYYVCLSKTSPATISFYLLRRYYDARITVPGEYTIDKIVRGVVSVDSLFPDEVK